MLWVWSALVWGVYGFVLSGWFAWLGFCLSVFFVVGLLLGFCGFVGLVWVMHYLKGYFWMRLSQSGGREDGGAGEGAGGRRGVKFNLNTDLRSSSIFNLHNLCFNSL